MTNKGASQKSAGSQRPRSAVKGKSGKVLPQRPKIGASKNKKVPEEQSSSKIDPSKETDEEEKRELTPAEIQQLLQ